MPSATGVSTVDTPKALSDRRAECAQLEQLLTAARKGTSGAIVLRGESGVGKSALLEYLLEKAAGCRVVRAAGVESEMELPFATLHQLCAPFLNRLAGLPTPQHDALATAFGLGIGPPPDRFLIGLAVLGLLSDSAEQQPLVCLVDDAHWIDRASAQGSSRLLMTARPIRLSNTRPHARSRGGDIKSGQRRHVYLADWRA